MKGIRIFECGYCPAFQDKYCIIKNEEHDEEDFQQGCDTFLKNRLHNK